VLLAATLAVPLWTHQLEFGTPANGSRGGPAYGPPGSCNRAAVCVAQWIRDGKLTGINGQSPALCLRVSAEEWASLSPCERREVWRDLALLGQVSRADRPVYVRDQDDRVIVAGMCRDAN
jgi:hypothetical protein